MSIRYNKVLINGVDVTNKIESLYETTYGYRVSFLDGKINAFLKSEIKIQPVEIKRKPFDISKHEINDHLTELENGVLGVNDSGWIIDKKRAIAIAKALGVTGEDLS